MTLHREGTVILIVWFIILGAIASIIYWLFSNNVWIYGIAFGVCLILFLLVAQFFRVPRRKVTLEDGVVVCPADGKVVVIENVHEHEYLDREVKQISVFMSPLNVHVNFNPISGVVKYFKYHPGLFLVAWHPKSSTDNERTTVVVEDPQGRQVLYRQIAGAVARRICWYVKQGQQVEQSEEFGFIKFGSRIDIFIPTDSEIHVEIGQKVQGSITRLATLPK
ncbi:MAG: phosphatidylserine decarboxylase family protein [Flavobacteriales bacterium]|nr:phosphatidylserine decarboxylase family protein [Flavobacteriales bacterium]